ncbi:hypothetical protein JCM21714_14 [Gracilibacillus boraciitolerans JCM 21714]|uniref:RNA polymerase sigma-70 region 4 domain-containing protein n=1 Tax=Gracilibacillus boraciitolerans JCM 21714 TaxID=1298598 RepID=W4VE38_9BACI|nr:sigma factor-like helix-turn-helix DNA-binding protein [Gracilibacillus boraciitolerans]GAE91078.1 hypothetical protein JCM21714_14 [Gracilibacillus boraciitolerans JCM 21714]
MEQLVELGETRENRIYSENELEHVIVYQDKEVIVPQEIFHMEFGQEDFFGNMKTIEEMRNYGYRTFGELPIDFQQLEQLKGGVGTVKVEQIFATLETVVESMLEDNKLNQMADDERLTYKLNQFVNWYHDVSNLDQPLISQRISAKYFKFVKKRYSAYLNGNHLTLEQLGNKEGVTRERIRQILKKGDGQLIEKWRKIHSLLQNKLRENGGIILAECLNKESEAFFMLLHAFETEGIYFDVINHTAILTVKDKHELESYVETIQQEVQRAFSLHVITNEELKTYSKERSIVDHVNVKIIFEIALDAVNWLSDDQGVLKNMTKSDAVEMVMLQYPNGVEVYKREDELINKANDLMPNSFHGERSFNAIIGREDNQDRFALWGAW